MNPLIMHQNNCKMICSMGTYQSLPCLNYCLSISKHQTKPTGGKTSRSQKLTTSLKYVSHSISQAKIASNGNPDQCTKQFKIRRRRRFLKKYETTSLISNLITPKEPQSISYKHMELNRANWTGRTSLLKNLDPSHSCV